MEHNLGSCSVVQKVTVSGRYYTKPNFNVINVQLNLGCNDVITVKVIVVFFFSLRKF